ncbi:MAG: DUF262 domain-containing HNH endonuclease family protein [bacterium]
MDLRAEELPLSKIFKDFAFTVPIYQRPYSWNMDHAIQLFQDITEASDAATATGSHQSQYFLGSIILTKNVGDPEAQILDGQQRLATLTMLLAVLRDEMPGTKLAEEINDYVMEKGREVEGTEDRYRLQIRDRERDFFRTNVQELGASDRSVNLQISGKLSDPERRIVENTKLFREQIHRMPEESRRRLCTFLVKNCMLVVVSTPHFNSAFRVFSRLNSRGLDLSHADILKAEIVGHIPAAEQDDYAKKWEDAEEKLGEDQFQALFGHMTMIKEKDVLREDLLSAFKRHFPPQDNPKEFINNTLLPHADIYEDVLGSSTGHDSIDRSLRWLNRIDNSDWIPPAIAFLLPKKTNPQLLANFFCKLERLAAGLLIMHIQGNKRISRYGRVLREIEAGSDVTQVGSPLDLTEDERHAIVQNLEGGLYLESPPIKKYVLQRLNSTMSDIEPEYEPRKTTIEHVLPQHPRADSDWTEWIPSEEDRQAWVHRLANLVLLSRRKNSEAGNYSLEEKKEKYFRSQKTGQATYALTLQIFDENTWTAEVLERRQRRLVDKLKSTWNL